MGPTTLRPDQPSPRNISRPARSTEPWRTSIRRAGSSTPRSIRPSAPGRCPNGRRRARLPRTAGHAPASQPNKKEAAPVGSPLFLLGEFNDTGLADFCHLDLARIAELAFDSLRDISGEDLGPAVVDRVRLDDDADLATCLDRERFLDAFERVSDAFQLFEPLDVGGERFPAGAWTGCRDRVAGHRQNRLEAGALHGPVLGSDRGHPW